MCQLEANVGMMHFEDGGRGDEPRNAGGWPLDSGRGEETESPLEPPEPKASQNFDLQNYKIIRLCCFNPLNLW